MYFFPLVTLVGAYYVQGTVLASQDPKMSKTVHAIKELTDYLLKQCYEHYNKVLYTHTMASQTEQAATQGVSLSVQATIMKYHRLNGLQMTEIYILQFWRLEVGGQGATSMVG